MFSVEFDRVVGIVKCRTEGFLLADQVASMIEAMRVAKDACRRSHGDMKMLVVTDGQVQSSETMNAVGAERAERVGIYDRRAFVLPSSLQKLQVGRVFSLPGERHFKSEQEAVAWLLADRINRPSVPPLRGPSSDGMPLHSGALR